MIIVEWKLGQVELGYAKVALIFGRYPYITHSFPSVTIALIIVLEYYFSLLPTMSDEVKACQSKILYPYLTVSAMQDVDIPSHVVEIERGESIGSTFLFLSGRFATPILLFYKATISLLNVGDILTVASTESTFIAFESCSRHGKYALVASPIKV